jgi:hypothetical protein
MTEMSVNYQEVMAAGQEWQRIQNAALDISDQTVSQLASDSDFMGNDRFGQAFEGNWRPPMGTSSQGLEQFGSDMGSTSENVYNTGGLFQRSDEINSDLIR